MQQALVFHQRLLRHANVLMVQPRITGFEPAQGAIGTRVNIAGNNLTNVTQVLFTYTVPAGNPVVTNHSALAFVDVPAIPSLVIQHTETASLLCLAWPGDDPRWILQSTSGFPIPGPPLWNEAPEVPEGIQTTQILLTNAPSAGNQFYRLVFDTTKVPPTNTICPCNCDP